MDVYAAQMMFGRGRRFDRIDIGVHRGRRSRRRRRSSRSCSVRVFRSTRRLARGQQFEAMTAAYSMMVNISSLFALFIGMFIIYNSFAIAVTQRRSEIGILRALGATRRQIRSLFLVESAMIGPRGIARWRGVRAADRPSDRRVHRTADHRRVRGRAACRGNQRRIPGCSRWPLLIGVATSVVAALIPARQAARVDPVQALQKGKYQVLSAGENRRPCHGAAVLGGASVGCLLIRRVTSAVFYVGYALAIIVALLLGPLLSLALAQALRPVLKWLRPVEGALAADSLIQAPRRTSASVAALMLSLALVVAFAGMARASYVSIIDWMETALNPDLFVMPSQDIVIRTLRFPETMGGRAHGAARRDARANGPGRARCVPQARR